MSKELIVIVEDNPKNLKLLRDVLGATGYRTLEATNAEEALELIPSELPALVLMDIQLPGMDGITARRKLSENPATQKIPVVAVTASAMPMDRKKILASGFDGYITKPINLKAFLAEVEAILAAKTQTSAESTQE
jgi:two-component system cell cycle response regulator DivK